MQTVTVKGFRLSFQQKHLWQWSQTSQIEHTQCAITIEGALDAVLFQQVLQQVVDHYEILHTTFYIAPGMDLPMQVLHRKGPIAFLFIDSAYLRAEEQGILVEEHWHDLQSYPFDLADGPQLHAALLRTSARSHTLLLSLPALCADASTLQQLISVLFAAYAAGTIEEAIANDEDELQYIDVSSWQDELLQGEEREELQAFWHAMKLSRLSDIPLPFQHPNKKNVPGQLEGQAPPQYIEVKLDGEMQHQLFELSQRYQVSPESCLLASWQILLWRLTAESPLLGLICDGRPHEELTKVLGPNAWTVPFALKTPFSPHLTFDWVLRQTEQLVQETVEKQLYFSRTMLAADQSQEQPIFPISFAYSTWPGQWRIGPLQASLLRQSSWSEPSPLQLQATQIGEHFHLQLRIHPAVYSLSVARRLVESYMTLLRHALTTPEARISSLALLTPAEQDQQHAHLRGQESDWPFIPLHHRFQIQARRRPDAPAVRYGEIVLNYQEVERQANQLAHLLLARGLRTGDRVALYQRRDHLALISLLGVLKAGGCYVPLDEDLPVPRVCLLLQEMAPTLILCSQDLAENIAKDIGESQVPVLSVEHWSRQLEEQPTTTPLVQVRPDDLAYVIYTSGSTGVPKGVEVRQGSVSNYIQAICELLEVDEGWHFATVSSLAADLGNTSIFCGFASGGCVHVLPYTLVTDGAALARYVTQSPIDVLKIVPSHLQALLAAAGKGILPGQRLILGGEALPWSLVEQLQQSGATFQLYNHYGPTEATIGALVNSLGPIDQLTIPDQRERGNSVPIGRPIANMQISIRDEQGQRMPRGIQAELYLAGMGLAAGYLEAPELTRERFVEIKEGGKGQRWYRTGDIARENEYGQIEFIGRQDSQVKVRGYRVELAEIEAYLRKHPAIREAVVELKEDQLVAYIVPWKKPGPEQQEVREALLAEVPPTWYLPGF
ncbi:hypothetical protein KSC_090850 [Ktedonobacter sp. SOSP1-52]|uniref:non-ribosomal peptide synthetase n=1 Tax=Ktedonobacter sp. SOSP1-52 TaxID=2778366 RepID=UPI00191535B9|nr:amino acid adenylation domain-containing protein [Ktedonobacter sp. SOSP1-52]GHO70193.1 hypothetical protein KSC_090850 [Ktedonobacter sp. SOSP1-52]